MPHAWFQKFTFVIFSLGFVASSYDYARFVKCTDASRIILCLCVTDMIITYDDVDGISIFKAELSSTIFLGY